MKSLITLIIALFSTLNLYCQEDSIDYDFINSALNQVVTSKKDSKVFLLLAYNINHGTRVINSFNNNELVNNIDSTTLKELLNKHNLINKTYVKFDKKKISKKTRITLIYSKRRNKLERKKNTIYYTISLPVTDSNNEFAIIEIAAGFGTLQMQGSKYLFRKIKGEWIFITNFGYWCS